VRCGDAAQQFAQRYRSCAAAAARQALALMASWWLRCGGSCSSAGGRLAAITGVGGACKQVLDGGGIVNGKTSWRWLSSDYWRSICGAWRRLRMVLPLAAMAPLAVAFHAVVVPRLIPTFCSFHSAFFPFTLPAELEFFCPLILF
jgi:hypothetical protein